MIIIEKIIDAQTGNEQIIEREETKQEKQEREETIAKFAQQRLDETNKATQRAAILERLGITEAEARLLFN